MYDCENSQAAGQSQHTNPQYQHPSSQFSPYNQKVLTSNTMALPVIATPRVDMVEQCFSNQGAQVFISLSLLV